jgi:hypothetical protein
MTRAVLDKKFDNAPLVFGNSRALYGLMLLVACAFVGAGVLLLANEALAARLIGVTSIVFFGGCAALFVRQLLDNRPRLVFDDVGVFDRTLDVGRIPWSDIDDARLMSIKGHHFISLSLRDEAKWTAKFTPLQHRLAQANRKLGFSALSLNLSGIQVQPEAVLALVLAHIARSSPDTAKSDL